MPLNRTDQIGRFTTAKMDRLPWMGSSGAYRNWLTTMATDTQVKLVHQEFISFTQSGKGVEAHFMDGSSRSAAMLIGADGASSRVRLQLMGEMPAHPSTKVCYQTLLDRHLLAGVATPYQVWHGEGISVALAAVSPQQIGLSISLRQNTVQPHTPEALKASLAEAVAAFPEIIQQAVALSWAEGWSAKGYSHHTQPDVWGRGRIALVGAAAHPLGYAAGFEADADILGAFYLAEGLAEHPRNLDKAFIHFEKKHKRRIKRLYKLNAYLQADLDRSGWSGRFARQALSPRLPNWMQGIRHWYKANR